MPHRLKTRQKKIQNKRKATPWREFVMEIASWQQFTFHKNAQGTISRYPPKRITNIVDPLTFEEQSADNLGNYEYDSGKGFFEQWGAHLATQTLPSLWQVQPYENCDYADTACLGAKNIYLTTGAFFNVENVFYSYEVGGYASNIYSSVMTVNHSDIVYQSAMIVNSFRVFYSTAIADSSDIRFSHNLQGCTHCIGCTNLHNQSYCIKNQQYTKEEYTTLKASILRQKSGFDRHYQAIKQHGSDTDLIKHSNNVERGIFVSHTNDSRNVAFSSRKESEKKEELYDVFSTGSSLVHAYGCMGVSPGEHIYITMNSAGTQLYYSYYLINCSHCLGCIGLKNKSYCIFNKQYTKEERYDKVDEIFSQMEKDGDLGKFFPGSMNPFYFNDTAAYLIDDTFTKEEVEAKGYMWRDKPIKVDIPAGAKVVKTTELDQYEGRITDGEFVPLSQSPRPPQVSDTPLAQGGQGEGNEPGGISTPAWSIDPEILKVIIQDEQGNVYRIIPMEYKFLKQHGLPLPRKHRLERVKDNFRTG